LDLGCSSKSNLKVRTGFANLNQHDKSTVNLITTREPAISRNMETLDAYYNGTFSLKITPPPSNETFDCPELKSQTIPNMFFRVGPQSRNNITRKAYGDENSYYFQFGRTLPHGKCPYTANKAFVHFESSNDELQQAQAWTLDQKKNGNKFKLYGTLTSKVANYGNYWNYVVNTTGSNINYPRKCPTAFSLRTMLASTGAKMNATVTATGADMTFEFKDTEQPGYIITGSFSGQSWDKGAHLLFDEDTIQTEGETIHVKPHVPKTFFQKYGKWIIVGVVIPSVLVAAWIIWRRFSCFKACFTCFRKERTSRKKLHKRNKSDQHHHVQQYTAITDSTPKVPVISYEVSVIIGESLGVTDGPYVNEIRRAQSNMNQALLDLRSAYDARSTHMAETMIAHHSALIGRYMSLRKAQRL
jgi:hypothetical protein